MSTTDKSTTSTTATTIPNSWEQIPCVQYGFADGKGPTRAPKLRTIFEQIPEDAITASPVYRLNRDQYERQEGFESGYEVEGVTSIATELQDECEADDRVLYPVHVESDELREVGPEPLLEWFREFIEGELGVPFHTCTLYFSGNRSIHAHVPRFVAGEDQREHLKELAETFCEETGAELDCGLYYAKRMFRLPGVEHEKTGVPKLEIDREWDNAQIAHKVEKATPNVPETYGDVLQHVFATQESLTLGSVQQPLDNPLTLFRVLDSDATVLDFGLDSRDIETPLIEQEEYPEDSAEAVKWLQYNAKEFSPYAFAEDNARSVAALRVKGGAFARKDKRNGATMVPAYYFGAVGANGEFTKDQEHAPLQLSRPDYKKWEAQPNDTVVIIGGQSRQSRILDVSSWDVRVVGHALTGEGGSREAALSYLEEEGYDIGSAGSSASPTVRSSSEPSGATSIWPARENPQTDAEALQRQAERDGIGTLTHPERIRVACRHLRYGWQPTWDWFEEQFGSEFKPQVTWEFLSAIVEEESFPEYESIVVPDSPA